MNNIIQTKNNGLIHLVVLILIAIIYILFASLGLQFTKFQQSWILIIGILLGGIPHGAVDHLVQEQKNSLSGKSYNLIRFYLQYILIMGIYGITWYFFPLISLTIFIFITAWHFGEADLFEFKWKSFQIRALFYSIYGLWVILFLLLSHWKEVYELLASLSNPEILIFLIKFSSFQVSFLQFFKIFGVLIGGIIYLSDRNKNKTMVLYLVLIYVLEFLPLYLAFTLYFTFWHSIRSLSEISSYLVLRGNILKFIILTLPNTLIAILFLGGFYLIWIRKFPSGSFILAVFILLSLLTMPHFFIMHSVFSRNKTKF